MGDSAHPAQLWGLSTIHVLQVVFILWQFPYNERIENGIQLIVAFQQGLFFAVLALAASDFKDSDLGTTLNTVNLVAMCVLVAGATKTQA